MEETDVMAVAGTWFGNQQKHWYLFNDTNHRLCHRSGSLLISPRQYNGFHKSCVARGQQNLLEDDSEHIESIDVTYKTYTFRG